jgi:hypothetical protein
MKLGSESDAWELEDAEERHRNAPDLYALPDIVERRSLRPGDHAELLFLFRGRDQHGAFIQGERLSVTVHDVSPSAYNGTLDEAPRSSALLRIGDPVSFELRHIARINRDGAASRHSP